MNKSAGTPRHYKKQITFFFLHDILFLYEMQEKYSTMCTAQNAAGAGPGDQSKLEEAFMKSTEPHPPVWVE